MKNLTLFYGAIAVALIAIAIDVYYALPGFPHILVTHTHGPYPKHLALFSAIAVICVVAALVMRLQARSIGR